MQRRKFIVGLGSLAAGGAAAMGTGALTEGDWERGVQGRVAADGPGSAYLEIDPSSNAGNEEHVKFDHSSGEMYLFFGDIGAGGSGVNPDGNNRFDSLFFARNQNPSNNQTHTYWLWVDSPSSKLTFYRNSAPGQSLEGIGNAKEMTRNGQGIPSIPVGVSLDLTDSGLGAGDDLTSLFDEDDQFVIYMEKTNGSPPA